ncbi:MAG: helix-turn-helix domain-containing protein [Candidatus Omnitrophica bacterium]|nr:helix-turn-helix domain-containing protein [Candidatus Omnitrophota bacterium]
MRAEEIKRYQVIQKVLDKEMNQQEAAEYLRVTDRQIRRVVKRVRVEGERGVIHKLRGKEGNRKIKVSFKKKVLEIYEKSYGDFGPTLASEKMREREGIEVNEETLRLWLIKAGLWQENKGKAKKDLGGLKGYIKQNGLPRIIYLDKHSTYKNNQKDKYTDWPFRDKEELTQFGRACKQYKID